MFPFPLNFAKVSTETLIDRGCQITPDAVEPIYPSLPIPDRS
jgi:hypothetical protein